MEMFFFARFHTRAGCEAEFEEAFRDVAGPSRAEPGCLSMHVFRSLRDPRLFFLHSRWVDEAAFDLHAAFPHTVRFIARAKELIDHPLDLTRTTLVD